MLYVPPPDLEGRYEILRVHTRKMKIANDVNLQKIAADTELFTGAELEGLCREAGFVALRENISAEAVCDSHFQTAKRSLKPALTEADIYKYASFMKGPSLKTSDGQFESSVYTKNNSFAPLFRVGIMGLVLISAAKCILMYTSRSRHRLAAT